VEVETTRFSDLTMTATLTTEDARLLDKIRYFGYVEYQVLGGDEQERADRLERAGVLRFWRQFVEVAA
jgi:hypothetical protein